MAHSLSVIIWFSCQSKIHRFPFDESLSVCVCSNRALSNQTESNFLFVCLAGFLFFFLLASFCGVRQLVQSMAYIEKHLRRKCQAVSTFHWQLKEFVVILLFLSQSKSLSLSLALNFSFSLSHPIYLTPLSHRHKTRKHLLSMCAMSNHLIFFCFFLIFTTQQNMIHTVDVIYFCHLKLIRFGFFGKCICNRQRVVAVIVWCMQARAWTRKQ